jgi:hypothetical protein
MHKITLKLSDILSLKTEIYGFTNAGTYEVLSEGIIRQKLSLPCKYWLNDLGKKLLAEEKAIESLHDELVIKYGEPDKDGKIHISPTIPTSDNIIKVNPKYIKFNEEYSLLLNEEKEIEYKPFNLSDLKNIVTDEYYPIFERLIVVNNVEEI